MVPLRPVVHTTATLVLASASLMALPALADALAGDPNWRAFALSGVLTGLGAAMVRIATRGGTDALTVEQAFLLTAAIWIILPGIAAVPYWLGAPGLTPLNAYFESMSGMTTTGTTVIPALETLPRGTHLWRAITQAMGGLGIVVVAMVFLPAMRVGGMQFFRSEGFDTMGKALPRAGDIAAELTIVYLALNFVTVLAFMATGMSGFDAVIHALTACSTGGFSNYDASLGALPPSAHYVAALAMILAAVPFIRMVQMVHGQPLALARDPQVRTFLRWLLVSTAAIIAWRLWRGDPAGPGPVVRESFVNVTSIFTGTGFGLGDATAWGALPFAVLIAVGLIGGCTGSTGCSVKVFRWMVLWAAVRGAVRRMRSPSRVVTLRYAREPLSVDVVDSVVMFFTLFILTFGLLIVGLSLTGLHPRTALTGAWTAICNIGPVWGPEVGGNGSVEQFPAAARAMMIAGMYLGRLEVITVIVLLLPRFWWNQGHGRPRRIEGAARS